MFKKRKESAELLSSVLVEFRTINGEINHVPFNKGETRVNLSEMGIVSIELSIFGEFSTLESLNLSRNHLEKLDLGTLSQCNQLEELDMPNVTNPSLMLESS